MASPKRADCVALIGAGTQGRRLAYMVCLPWSPRLAEVFSVPIDSSDKFPQWSKRGHGVRLIDSQPSQLQASLAYIQMLRRSDESTEDEYGDVTIHDPASMSETLTDTWLVVEVSVCICCPCERCRYWRY